MDGIQAAILRIKLRHLDRANQLRREHARQYDQLLDGIDDVITPREATERKHIYHIYPIRVPERDELIRSLPDRGIESGIHYPIPVHLQEAYSSLGYAKGSFPVSERTCSELVSLPMFPELTSRQVGLVAAAVKESRLSAVV